MRALTVSEMGQVAGAASVCDIHDAVKNPVSSDNVQSWVLNVYDGLVDATSYIIGRVAGDLHPDYYN